MFAGRATLRRAGYDPRAWHYPGLIKYTGDRVRTHDLLIVSPCYWLDHSFRCFFIGSVCLNPRIIYKSNKVFFLTIVSTFLTPAVNFINIFRARFSYVFLAPSWNISWCQKFVQKTCAKKVDDIDTLTHT